MHFYSISIGKTHAASLLGVPRVVCWSQVHAGHKQVKFKEREKINLPFHKTDNCLAGFPSWLVSKCPKLWKFKHNSKTLHV